MMIKSVFSPLKFIDKATLLTIFVAALGYFVDIFDLILFGVVRVPSLKSIGVPDADILSTGFMLINLQMAGLLVGGFVWGVLGDKFGRLSVLLGSILLYSLANLGNAFVDSVTTYGILRFVSGIGLAGELGLSITLISELLPISYRGLGATFIGGIGMLGAIAAALIGDGFGWRMAYGIGGGMGFVLLLMRFGLKESQFFLALCHEKNGIKRGHLFSLFSKPRLFIRYIAVILIPLPLLIMIWVLVALTPEFARNFGVSAPLQAGTAILFCYIGLTIGDTLSGLLCQFLKSRRQTIAFFLFLLVLACCAHLIFRPATAALYYASCLFMGIGGGYWIIAIQFGAEQFGTNIRATATTSVPTVARALIIPATLGFKTLSPSFGMSSSWAIIMALSVILSVLSLWSLKETFHNNLDYVE